MNSRLVLLLSLGVLGTKLTEEKRGVSEIVARESRGQWHELDKIFSDLNLNALRVFQELQGCACQHSRSLFFFFYFFCFLLFFPFSLPLSLSLPPSLSVRLKKSETVSYMPISTVPLCRHVFPTYSLNGRKQRERRRIWLFARHLNG